LRTQVCPLNANAFHDAHDEFLSTIGSGGAAVMETAAGYMSFAKKEGWIGVVTKSGYLVNPGKDFDHNIYLNHQPDQVG